jgi:hypothetical protein
MAPVAIKEHIKQHPVPVLFSDTGLKGFQEAAFAAAYAYLMHTHYSE